MTRIVHRLQIFAVQILAVTIIFPTLLLAQEELLDEEQVPIKRYTVELIVFSYQENVAVGTELFPADQIEIPSEETAEIVVGDQIRRPPQAVAPAPVFLREDQFTMNNVVKHLELLDAYQPIMHVGWTQVGFPLQDTKAMTLNLFGAPPPGLDGSFTLYLERYLHLVINLSLDAPVEVIEISFDDNSSYELEDTAPPDGPVRYRIQEDRIVKNGEIRYFDHPKFGVVAKVSRIEENQSGAALLSRTSQ